MRPTSLKEAVDRIVAGQNWMDAVSEFLDEFYMSGPEERQRMIGEELTWACGPPETMKIGVVVPAKAGTHRGLGQQWIPAFAGMTNVE